MKANLFVTLTLLTLMAFPLAAPARDGDGHTLTRLWADYDKAVRDDRPKDQADILQKIKREATARHLPWDFYDAAVTYVQVRSQTDWKLTDELRRQAEQELEAFGEPVAILFYRLHHRGLEELQQNGANIMGCVLNGGRVRFGTSYVSRYGSYGSYQAKEKKES